MLQRPRHQHAQLLQGEAEAKEGVEQEQAPQTAAAAPSAIENPLFEESTSKVSAELIALIWLALQSFVYALICGCRQQTCACLQTVRKRSQ